MNTTPTTRPASGWTVAALVAALLLFGFAAYEWRIASISRSSLLVAHQEYDSTERDLRTAARKAQAAERKRGELSRALTAATGPDAGAAGGRPANAAGGNGRSLEEQKFDGQKFLAAYPQAREMVRGIGRAQYELIYAPFLRTAGLNPAQIEQLESATMDIWLQSIAITPQGAIRPTIIQPPDAQLRTILGDQAFQQFQDYTRATPAQGVVVQVAAGSGLASAPLSSDQTTQLSKIVASNSLSYQNGKAIDLAQVDWNAATAALQSNGSFSPPQLAAAERVFVTLQYQLSLNQARRNAAAAK